MQKTIGKHGLTIRSDSLYCPLALSLDSYANCLIDCWHCYLRRLNYVWGDELRPTDPEALSRKLHNGLRNPKPKSCLAYALKRKTTIRFGNKADPFQPVEAEHHVTREILDVLLEQDWTYVIQTMCTDLMMSYEDIIVKSKDLVIVQPQISPGAELDWETFERKRTTPVPDRFDAIKSLSKQGVKTAVYGEPFIPGWHTIEMFTAMMKRLRSHKIKNYNTYNFHFNDFVAKRLAALGIDIEKIRVMNQDINWKPIQRRLCDIAWAHDVILGCPDFVNVRPNWNNLTNTCCGIDVEKPTTYNTHTWRNLLLDGKSAAEIDEKTWDGVGNREEGMKILTGKSKKMYTMLDAGLIKPPGEGGLLY